MSQPTSQIQSLAETLRAEQARCRALLLVYKYNKTSPFAISLEAALRRADQAVMSGDAVAMLRSYQELKDHE